MDKRLLAVIGGLSVVIVMLMFFLAFRDRTPKNIEPDDALRGYLQRAETNVKEGNLLEAQKMYAGFIDEHADSKYIEDVQEELERISMKILFSPVETEDSVIYTVKHGDNLRKIAKQHNTTVELLMKSNGLTSDLIHPGKRLKVTKAAFSIMADKSQNLLMLKADDRILKVYKVSTGFDGNTPTGEFKIVNKLIDPTWFKAGAVVASGSPGNILGTRWMGLTVEGYGIHGTTEPETIGRQITAGCIRMLNEDVEELYTIVPVGTEVTIVD